MKRVSPKVGVFSHIVVLTYISTYMTRRNNESTTWHTWKCHRYTVQTFQIERTVASEDRLMCRLTHGIHRTVTYYKERFAISITDLFLKEKDKHFLNSF